MREEASFHMFFLKKMTSSYLEKEKFWVIMKEKLLQTLYLKLRNTATIFLEATDIIPQQAFTYSKLIIETLEQGVKHVHS